MRLGEPKVSKPKKRGKKLLRQRKKYRVWPQRTEFLQPRLTTPS